jgi:hypothetical protein
MDKIINILILVLLLGSCIFNVLLVSDLNKKTMELIELTDIEPEIIFIDSIEYDTVYIEKTEIVKLPIYHTDTVKQTDTLTLVEIDSVDVVVPIELKQFNDTFSNMAISFDLRGYNCKVDNLYVENLKTSVIKENKPKRICLGLQLGMGATKEGFNPYIGLGISYNLFSF